MEDILLAVGKVSKVEEIAKGTNNTVLRTTLKLTPQTIDGTKNLDHNLSELLIKGQLEFGKTYEVIVRLGAQLELPARMIREEDDPFPQTAPAPLPIPGPFTRPKKKTYKYDDYDDEDINI